MLVHPQNIDTNKEEVLKKTTKIFKNIHNERANEYFFLNHVSRGKECKENTPQNDHTLAFTFFSERGWGIFKRKQDVCHSAELVFSHSHPSVLQGKIGDQTLMAHGVSSSSYSNDYHTTTTTNSRDGLRAGCERRTRTATETIVSSVLTLALSTQGVRGRTYTLAYCSCVLCVQRVANTSVHSFADHASRQRKIDCSHRRRRLSVCSSSEEIFHFHRASLQTIKKSFWWARVGDAPGWDFYGNVVVHTVRLGSVNRNQIIVIHTCNLPQSAYQPAPLLSALVGGKPLQYHYLNTSKKPYYPCVCVCVSVLVCVSVFTKCCRV